MTAGIAAVQFNVGGVWHAYRPDRSYTFCGRFASQSLVTWGSWADWYDRFGGCAVCRASARNFMKTQEN